MTEAAIYLSIKVSNGAMLCMMREQEKRGRREDGIFSWEVRQNAQMKEQERETGWRKRWKCRPPAFNTLLPSFDLLTLSPSGLLHGFPHQHHHQTCSASSQGWSALRFPSAGGEKHLYQGSPERLHVLIMLSSVLTASVISTSAIQALYESPATCGGRKIKHLLSLSISLLCSHGFLLSHKGNCQEELFTISCLKYRHL